MKQTISPLAMMILSIGMLCIMSGYVNAAPFAFSVDRFQVTGNLPVNAVDEFYDGYLSPWIVDNGTAIEGSGVLTLTNPGDINTIQIDNFFITQEESEVYIANTPFMVADGAGDFVATSTWTTGTSSTTRPRSSQSRARCPLRLVPT